MNVDNSMCAPVGSAKHETRSPARLECVCARARSRHASTVKATRCLTVLTGSAHAGLGNGLSRMRGNSHVRF